jgi:hypothetical protein
VLAEITAVVVLDPLPGTDVPSKTPASADPRLVQLKLPDETFGSGCASMLAWVSRLSWPHPLSPRDLCCGCPPDCAC